MPEQVQQQNNYGQEKARYANVKMPSAFITPYEYTAKSGKTFEKAYVHFPEGTKVNGIDLSHYSCDVFLNDRMKQQMLSGGQVTVGFPADKPVEVWTGKKDDPEHPYQKFECNPWNLVHGLKEANESFKAEKAAEREEAKDKGVSLGAVAEEARESSTVLEGHDVSDGLSQSR